MQTKQVLETIRRIEAKFAPIVERLNTIQNMIYGPPRPGGALGRIVLEITYLFGDFIETVQRDAYSVKVIEAFELSETILQKEFWFKVANALPTSSRGEDPRVVTLSDPEVRNAAIEAWRPIASILLMRYDRMVTCVKPLMALTIPPDLLNEQREGVLAVNLSDRESLNLKVLAKVIDEVEALYDTINRIFGRTEAPPLQIIRIESGSNLRIDLRGLAETVKELKSAVLEIWTKHRHKKADEIIDQHRVVSSGIEVLTQIDNRVKKKELTGEDGVRFRRAIVQSTLGLFKSGALIDEIPPIEVVDNVKLLDGFAYKLLAAPRDDYENQAVEMLPAVSEGASQDSVQAGDALLTLGAPVRVPRRSKSKTAA